eukprot:3412026-Prymnesium_polylepis.1
MRSTPTLVLLPLLSPGAHAIDPPLRAAQARADDQGATDAPHQRVGAAEQRHRRRRLRRERGGRGCRRQGMGVGAPHQQIYGCMCICHEHDLEGVCVAMWVWVWVPMYLLRIFGELQCGWASCSN